MKHCFRIGLLRRSELAGPPIELEFLDEVGVLFDDEKLICEVTVGRTENLLDWMILLLLPWLPEQFSSSRAALEDRPL